MRKIFSKRQDFQAEIRRKHIEEKFSQVRRMSDLDFTTPNDIARHMQLPQRQQQYTLLELLSKKQHALLNPPFGGMQQEGLEKLPLQLHLRFWKLYSEQLYRKEVEYDQRIGQILLQLIDKYQYGHIHENTAYELHVLNMLQLVAPFLQVHFRKKIIEWIAGAEGLRVVEACLSDGKLEFLKCNHYPLLYKVIESGLKSELKTESDDAALILKLILLKADWDDSFQIYEQCHGLMIYLCLKIERYYREQAALIYNRACLFMLDTYDEAVIDYARSGLAFTACLLVSSPIKENYTDGLEMLRMMTQIDDKRMISFLLEDKQIEGTGIWKHLCQEESLVKNESYKVREHYQAVIHNILAVGEQIHIESLCKHFDNRYEDIFQMFFEELDSNQDYVDIICIILRSLRSLVYYGRQTDKPHRLMQILERRGILRILECESGREGDIGESAKNVLDTLYYNS